MRLLALALALLLLVVSQASRAEDCSQNAQKLNSGAVAPCSGWLFSPSYAQETAKNVQLLENKDLQLSKLNQLNKLTEAEVEFYKKRSENLAKENYRQSRNETWKSVGYFVLGSLVMGLAVKVGQEAAR